MSAQDIGKLLFAGFEDTVFTPECQAGKLIKQHHVHCFLLQPHNFVNIAQFKRLIDDLQTFAYSLNYSTPLIIAVDQKMLDYCREHGTEHFTKFPCALALSATNKLMLIYEIGKVLALELRAIGINMFFGPNLDICSKLFMQVVGLRSFGVSVLEVVRFGGSFACGLKNGGILTCATHFPGIGNSLVNPVTESPMMMDTFEQININAQTFKKIIEHDLVDSILLSVVETPNVLSGDVNTCLNPKIVDGLLRDKYNFDKLVISECLEVKGIFNNYGIGQASVLAIAYARCDMITVCHTYKYQLEALDFLQKSFGSGNHQAILVTALRRVDQLLNKISWFDSKIELNGNLLLNRKLSEIAYSDSICLIKDFSYIIPIQNFIPNNIEERQIYSFPSQDSPDYFILFLTPAMSTMDSIFEKLTEDFKEHSKTIGCSVKRISYSTRGITPEIELQVDKCVLVTYICTDIYQNDYQLDMIKELTNILRRLNKFQIIISIDSPYAFFNDDCYTNTFLCTYDSSYEALKHIPPILFGKMKPKGRTPGYFRKLNSREEVVMGLSDNLKNSKLPFDFLLNEPTRNRSISSKIATPTTVQFDDGIFTDMSGLTSLLNNENGLNMSDSSSYLDLDISNLPSQMNKSNHESYDNVEKNLKNEYNGQMKNTSSNNDEKKWNEKPWVVEVYDSERDKLTMNMLRTSSISDLSYPLDIGLLTRYMNFAYTVNDTQKIFVVRNASIGMVYGVITVIYDKFEQCGRIVYMIVSKAKKRHGIGETLHRRAIQYLILERGCKIIGLGCCFPFFNFFTLKLLGEFNTIWQYLETKDDSQINIDDSSIELVGFYRSLGWLNSRYKKGISQPNRKHIMHLQLDNWNFPGTSTVDFDFRIENPYHFFSLLEESNLQFIASDNAKPGFEICHYLLKSNQTTDDEEVLFSSMYSKAEGCINEEIFAANKCNERRSTFVVYALTDDRIRGACIIYTNNSAFSYFYPIIDQIKTDPVEIVAGITGIFVGNSMQSQDQNGMFINKNDDYNLMEKKLVRMGLITAAVQIIGKLGIKQTIIHNISKEELPILESCGFNKHTEYFPSFGKKNASEWVV